MKRALAPLAYGLLLHHAARSRVKPPEKTETEDPAESFLFQVLDGGKAQDPASSDPELEQPE